MNGDFDTPPADLDWLAFRYVAGEMVAEEARALEERLATDQAAREAVSRAVALGLELAAARPVVAGSSAVHAPVRRRTRSIRLRPLAGSAVGMAASIALVAGAYVVWRSHADRDQPRRPLVAEAPKRAEVEAVAWLELRKLGDSVVQIEHGLVDWESSEFTEPTTGLDPADVPEWLVSSSVAAEGGK